MKANAKWRSILASLLVSWATPVIGQTAVDAIKEQADKGDAESQNTMGLAFKNGHGVKQDFVLAQSWFQKAAEKGDTTAMVELGRCYQQGEGVTKDEAEGFRWFLQAGERGSAASEPRATQKR